ncbi:D-alanyl-D-alanine dipeptidase [Dongia sp.]|uniref:D-alanyl-D-alanine dipeptidase n=1 Tax=Dongia sp. TaxID=1977262 RepID=UPI0035B15445
MSLIEITPAGFDVDISLVYATPHNLSGSVIYKSPDCYLHERAADLLRHAVHLAQPLGLRFKIFDAYRPSEAQWALWNALPDPEFVADPRRGSPHTRGVAIDLTLVDAAGRELDMGTGFDEAVPQSHHGSTEVSVAAQQNRFTLLGIMMAAGWDNYKNEWWHYQLFNSRDYPLIEQAQLPRPMM